MSTTTTTITGYRPTRRDFDPPRIAEHDKPPDDEVERQRQALLPRRKKTSATKRATNDQKKD